MIEKIAKQEACQLFIEQEIEKGLLKGKTKYAIGKEISAWLWDKLGVKYKPKTISKRAERIATNVAKPKTYKPKDTKPTVENSRVGASTEQLRLKGHWIIRQKSKGYGHVLPHGNRRSSMNGLSSSLVVVQKREMSYDTVIISNVKTEQR